MTAINFSNALGLHEQALSLRVQRAEVIANNLANADTPGFKARDIDFESMLNAVSSSSKSGSLSLQTTHSGHLTDASANDSASAPLLYREPTQSSLDGNTVDTQYESAQFAKNALDFASSFRLLNGRFSGLSKAIKGE